MLEGRFSDERMRKQAEVYEKGVSDAAKHFVAGSGYPVDVLEGFSQGIFFLLQAISFQGCVLEYLQTLKLILKPENRCLKAGHRW